VQYLTISNWVPFKAMILFLYELLPLFIRHYSPEHRIVGTLLAIFGGKILMVRQPPLPDDQDERTHLVHEQGFGAYHLIYQLAVGLAIVTLVDMSLNQTNSREASVEGVFKGMDATFKSFRDFMQPLGSSEEEATSELARRPSRQMEVVEHGGVRISVGTHVMSSNELQGMDSLDDWIEHSRTALKHFTMAETLAGEANSEPKFLSKPFPGRLVLALVDQFREIAEKMLAVQVAFVVGNGKAPDKYLYDLVTKRPAWRRVCGEITDNMTQVEALIRNSLALGGENKNDLGHMKAFESLDDLQQLVKEVQEERERHQLINGAPIQEDHPTLIGDYTSRLASIFETLELVQQGLNRMTHMTLENL